NSGGLSIRQHDIWGQKKPRRVDFLRRFNSAAVAVGHHVMHDIDPAGDEFKSYGHYGIQLPVDRRRANDLSVFQSRKYDVSVAGFASESLKIAVRKLCRDDCIDVKSRVGLAPDR